MFGFKLKQNGVSWDKKKEKWKACIKKKSQIVFLGYYTNKELAKKEYDRAILELGLNEAIK
jgi:hypothetical protein